MCIRDRSSRAASSVSVVKLSSAAAKSSVAEGFSSRFWIASLCADWGWGESLFKVEPSADSTGRSTTEVEVAESMLWALLSSGKVDGLSRVFRARGCGDCLLYTSDAADERSSVDLGGRRII